jgi:ABC-2 type transport system permease protein
VTALSETPTIELRDVRGPRAFGGPPSRFLHLLWTVSKTELRTRYQGAVFGLLWSILEPLLIFAVMYAVFNSVTRFGGSVPHYPAMLLMSIMLYRAMFSSTTSRSVTCVVARESLVRKTQFPRIIVPLSVVLTATLLFVGDMAVLAVFLFIDGVQPMWTWLLFPVIVLMFLLLTIGVSLLLASLYVHFRDTLPIWGVVTLILFYGSPIIFPVEAAPSGLREVLFFANPFVPLLEQGRIWLLDPNAPAITDVSSGPLSGLLVPGLVYLAGCTVGLWYFIRRAPRVAEEL